MNIYPAITFFHIAGAITLFISWALKYDYFKSINQLSTINEDMTVSRKFKNYSQLGSNCCVCNSGVWFLANGDKWGIFSLDYYVARFYRSYHIHRDIIFAESSFSKARWISHDVLFDKFYQTSNCHWNRNNCFNGF